MDDLISRQDAIDIMLMALDDDWEIDYATDRMNELPSAQKTGHWVKAQRRGITEYSDGYSECDQCHEVSWLGWSDKYCRNCGAKMEVEHERA